MARVRYFTQNSLEAYTWLKIRIFASVCDSIIKEGRENHVHTYLLSKNEKGFFECYSGTRGLKFLTRPLYNTLSTSTSIRLYPSFCPKNFDIIRLKGKASQPIFSLYKFILFGCTRGARQNLRSGIIFRLFDK